MTSIEFISRTLPYTVYKPSPIYIFAEGTALLLPLYSPRIRAISVLEGLQLSSMPHSLAHESTAARFWRTRSPPHSARSDRAASPWHPGFSILFAPFMRGSQAGQLGACGRLSLDGRTDTEPPRHLLTHTQSQAEARACTPACTHEGPH
jgi:hypothetical protein